MISSRYKVVVGGLFWPRARCPMIVFIPAPSATSHLESSLCRWRLNGATISTEGATPSRIHIQLHTFWLARLCSLSAIDVDREFLWRNLLFHLSLLLYRPTWIHCAKTAVLCGASSCWPGENHRHLLSSVAISYMALFLDNFSLIGR